MIRPYNIQKKGDSPGDYYADPIRDIQRGTITHWQPMPKPPVQS